MCPPSLLLTATVKKIAVIEVEARQRFTVRKENARSREKKMREKLGN